MLSSIFSCLFPSSNKNMVDNGAQITYDFDNYFTSDDKEVTIVHNNYILPKYEVNSQSKADILIRQQQEKINSSKVNSASDSLPMLQQYMIENSNKLDTSKSNITDVESQEYHKLELIEVKGNILNNDICTFNAKGLLNGGRDKKDGYSYFGFGDKNKIQANNKYPLDYELNPQGENISTNVLFSIYFNLESKNYTICSYLSDCDKTMVFIRLSKEFYKLKKTNIVSIGDIFLLVEIDSVNNLRIDLINKQEYSKSKVFNSKFIGLVGVGRDNYNEIYINNSKLSRINSAFQVINDCWYLMDGNGSKSSSNGTWIHLIGEWEIKSEEMTIKINQSYLLLKTVKYSN